MKITYYENLPLDGAGTLINPAHKWLRVERTEFCDNLQKAGNLWYMMRGGYVHHSIDVEKITNIETKSIHAQCSYDRHNADFPFFASMSNGTSFGADTFETMYGIIIQQ